MTTSYFNPQRKVTFSEDKLHLTLKTQQPDERLGKTLSVRKWPGVLSANHSNNDEFVLHLNNIGISLNRAQADALVQLLQR